MIESDFNDTPEFDEVNTQDDWDDGLTSDEEDDFEEITPVRGRISYSTASMDILGLVNRINRGDIVIPRIGSSDPVLEVRSFQRGFVWKRKQMDSFVESMLLGYPTPSLFMVGQPDGRMVVLDGQQRLETLVRFYSGSIGKRQYKLSLEGSPYDGLSYAALAPDSKRFLNNTYLTATIIRLEEAPDAVEAVYDVFARLNSGGTRLTPHEIRLALYSGSLMEVIAELNAYDPWQRICRVPSMRFRDHELVLRIVSLFMDGDRYQKPFASFLNLFAGEHRDNVPDDLVEVSDLFRQAADAWDSLGDRRVFFLAGGNRTNIAKAEALMVAMMTFAREGCALPPELLEDAAEKLRDDPDFIDAVTRSTSDEAKVKRRIEIALEALRGEDR